MANDPNLVIQASDRKSLGQDHHKAKAGLSGLQSEFLGLTWEAEADRSL